MNEKLNSNLVLCGEDNSLETISESVDRCNLAWKQLKDEWFQSVKTAIENAEIVKAEEEARKTKLEQLCNEDKVTDGLKHDGGKARLDLVPPEIIEAVGKVMTFGAQKYGEASYKQVDPKRYRAAFMRHVCKWLKNPHGLDTDSGLPHLWHIACNVAFLLELDKGGDGDV
jgi:hypothetical protein